MQRRSIHRILIKLMEWFAGAQIQLRVEKILTLASLVSKTYSFVGDFPFDLKVPFLLRVLDMLMLNPYLRYLVEDYVKGNGTKISISQDERGKR